jgi:hypothetical protein
LKKTNCRLNFGLKEWELEEWFLDWWNNGLLEEFDKVECWNDGKVEVSIWKKILSERRLAFADPAMLI